MMQLRSFIKRVKSVGRRYDSQVTLVAMGAKRTFEAYDIGPDTFILERGVSAHFSERPSVLIVSKSALGRKGRGRVMTMSNGNHSVAAFPLLDGRFWKLSRLEKSQRSEVLMHFVLCANVVGDTLEISQREVALEQLIADDRWLCDVVGLGMDGIVMLDRNEATLEHFRRLGQEWRVKPLAWTEQEMKTALAASRKRIASKINYYHSSRGVHILSLSEFKAFAQLSRSEPEEFQRGLDELVGIFEDNETSFVRMPKYRGHHEIEFFGIRLGEAMETLIPELERLYESMKVGEVGRLGMIKRAEDLVATFESLLTRSELADENSKIFVETMYMHITGEVYAIAGEGLTPAFDDRRTALPGATFEKGEMRMHPGADSRSAVLLSNLSDMLSKDEIIEYANIYELRDEESDSPLGKGLTREVVYKTNLRPLEAGLIEKGLSSRRGGYSEYVLARVGALRSLGVKLSGYYRLLRRGALIGRRMTDFYVRQRCEGEPMESIPQTYYRSAEDVSKEDPEVVLDMAMLMGDAAAQTIAMKKFDPHTESPLFGVGKEIYGFEYDILKKKMLPKKVSICSIRSSLGWPDLEYSDDNLRAIAGFYFTHFAHALKAFQRQHPLKMRMLAERFMSGFAYRTRAMAWRLSVMRDKFEEFAPEATKRFGFARKWRFVIWSLERQERRLAMFRKMFYEKLEVVENEDVRNNPQ